MTQSVDGEIGESDNESLFTTILRESGFRPKRARQHGIC